MNRHERIRTDLDRLLELGVIVGGWYSRGNMPGKRWYVQPRQYSERAMSTNEIEWFILGAKAGLGVY